MGGSRVGSTCLLCQIASTLDRAAVAISGKVRKGEQTSPPPKANPRQNCSQGMSRNGSSKGTAQRRIERDSAAAMYLMMYLTKTRLSWVPGYIFQQCVFRPRSYKTPHTRPARDLTTVSVFFEFRRLDTRTRVITYGIVGGTVPTRAMRA